MIEINIDPILVSANFVIAWVVSWHGFFSFVAVGTAVILVSRWAPLRGLTADTVYSLAIWAIIGGVVGARLVHVIDYWSEIYQQAPGEILSIYSGGASIQGGILGGLAGGTLYCLVAKLPLGAVVDLVAPAIPFVLSIGRLGDIVNGEHCARATDFFLRFMWTHEDTSARGCASGFTSAVHPVIAYEIVWNMACLAIIWQLRGKLKPDGMLFALYLALYSIGRFAIQFYRDDRVWALGMQEAHYISLLILAVTVPLIAIKGRFTERVLELPRVIQRGTRAERRRRSRR